MKTDHWCRRSCAASSGHEVSWRAVLGTEPNPPRPEEGRWGLEGQGGSCHEKPKVGTRSSTYRAKLQTHWTGTQTCLRALPPPLMLHHLDYFASPYLSCISHGGDDAHKGFKKEMKVPCCTHECRRLSSGHFSLVASCQLWHKEMSPC